MQENTKRILHECEAYDDAIKLEEDKVYRIKAIHSTLLPIRTNASSTHNRQSSSCSTGDGDGAAIIRPLLTETQSLQNEYQKLEEEIKNLNIATKHEEEKMIHLNEKEDSFFHNLNSLEITNNKHHDSSGKLSLERKSSQKELELFHHYLDYDLGMKWRD